MFCIEKKAKVDTRKSPRTFRALWATLSLALILGSSPSQAISEGELFQNAAFMQLFAVILETNNAMKIAAHNPMNKDARRKVREAIQKIPPALIGLAEVFESGKLHDGDYQYIMSMLGGFVDQKSAPQIYSQFLKKPSPELIPKAGASVQARLDREGPASGGRIVYDESAPAADGQALARQSAPASSTSREVVNLSSVGSMDDGDSKPSSRIVYDEGATAIDGAALAGPGFTNGSTSGTTSESRTRNSAGSANPSSPTRNGGGVSRTLASEAGSSIELQSELSVIESEVELTSEEKAEKEKSLKRKKPSGRPSAKPSPFAPKQGKPTSWMHLPAQVKFLTFALFLVDKHAHANGAPPAGGQPAGQQGSGCQQCGGQGGEGGGGGGDASQLLFGAAAIMAAIVPAIVAAEQADADKEIAQTNAEAQKYMTDAVAKNSETLAGIQAETAKYQTDAQVQSVALSNAATTERLNMQLSQLETSQARIAELEKQQFEAEQQLNLKRLELSEQQLAANVSAAQAAQNLAITQAGLTTGTIPGEGGSSLTITSTNMALAEVDPTATSPLAANAEGESSEVGSTAFTGSSSSASRGIAATGSNASGSTGSTTGASVNSPSGNARGITTAESKAAEAEGSAGKPPSPDTVVFAESSHSDSGSSSSGSFLSSLMPAAPEAASPSQRLAMSIGAPSSSSTNLSRAMTGETQVVAYLQGQRDLNGSTRAVRARETKTKPGDLGRFIASTEAPRPDESFAQFQQEEATRGGNGGNGGNANVAHGFAAGASHGGGASASRGLKGGSHPTAEPYNPPSGL